MSVSAGTPAERMGFVPSSGIRQIFERAKPLEREGRPVIFLETGRPDFDTPAHIKQAANRALDAGEGHYTSNYGIPALCAASADKRMRNNGLARAPETEVLVTVGAAEAILAPGEGYVRFSYANSYENLAEAVRRPGHFLC